MTELRKGRIGWIDLTVDDADVVRDFYRDVVGFETSTVAMGDYDDYCLHPPGSDPVAGVCHARGGNVGLPPVWLVYFTVEDLDTALAACRARGGEIVVGPKSTGEARYAVVRDPAGAASALFQPAPG